MKPKTCIVLSVLAVVLRVLALIAVLAVTVFQEPIKRMYNPDPEILAIHSVPWSQLVQALFWLILAGIVLLVLLKRPGKGGTIALTIVMAVIYAFFSVVVFFTLNMQVTQAISIKGAKELASNAALSNALSIGTPLFSTPASILSLLALGGTCWKDFRVQNTAE